MEPEVQLDEGEVRVEWEVVSRYRAGWPVKWGALTMLEEVPGLRRAGVK